MSKIRETLFSLIKSFARRNTKRLISAPLLINIVATPTAAHLIATSIGVPRALLISRSTPFSMRSFPISELSFSAAICRGEEFSVSLLLSSSNFAFAVCDSKIASTKCISWLKTAKCNRFPFRYKLRSSRVSLSQYFSIQRRMSLSLVRRIGSSFLLFLLISSVTQHPLLPLGPNPLSRASLCMAKKIVLTCRSKLSFAAKCKTVFPCISPIENEPSLLSIISRTFALFPFFIARCNAVLAFKSFLCINRCCLDK